MQAVQSVLVWALESDPIRRDALVRVGERGECRMVYAKVQGDGLGRGFYGHGHSSP